MKMYDYLSGVSFRSNENLIHDMTKELLTKFPASQEDINKILDKRKCDSAYDAYDLIKEEE